jgi:hypothetical protein
MAKFSYVTGTRDRTRAIALRVSATLEHKQKQKISVIYFHSKNAGKMHFLVTTHLKKKKRENAFFGHVHFQKMNFSITTHFKKKIAGKMHFLVTTHFQKKCGKMHF